MSHFARTLVVVFPLLVAACGGSTVDGGAAGNAGSGAAGRAGAAGNGGASGQAGQGGAGAAGSGDGGRAGIGGGIGGEAGGPIDGGSGPCSDGTVNFKIEAPTGQGSSYCAGGGCNATWLTILAADGKELTIRNDCMTTCSACMQTGCPPVCQVPPYVSEAGKP